jgi:hypothetical protein
MQTVATMPFAITKMVIILITSNYWFIFMQKNPEGCYASGV